MLRYLKWYRSQCSKTLADVVAGLQEWDAQAPPSKPGDLRDRLQGTPWQADVAARQFLARLTRKQADQLIRTRVELGAGVQTLPTQALHPIHRRQLEQVSQWPLRASTRALVAGWLSSGEAPIHRIRCFSKIEPLTKAPRLVCPMEPWMNAMLGPATMVAERVLGSHKSLVKGLDLQQRAARLSPLIRNNCMFAETDYSAFDRTIHVGLRRIEWELYRPYLSEAEEAAYVVLVCLSVLMHAELAPGEDNSRVVTESMRYSGEPGTSIGNAIINLFVWWSNPSRPQTECGGAFAEGDDGLVGCTSEFDCTGWAARFGLDLKCEWHRDFRQVKFCGRYLGYDAAGNLVSFADVRRALDKFHLCMGDPHLEDAALLRGKCLSAMAMDLDTPGVGWCAYAHYLRAGDGPVASTADDRWKATLCPTAFVVRAPVVCDEAYEQMRCQGLCPASLREFDMRMQAWALMGGEKPIIDFGASKLKVEVYTTGAVVPA